MINDFEILMFDMKRRDFQRVEILMYYNWLFKVHFTWWFCII